ncbi:xenobiotic-transporting ATPase [Lentilactobacillus senioris DSM 24302 = JCM 17472]|uniref:Xenobiotic-transporting ATPase n=1 Tax=Lentilactobacillus senioris DSM 24302 = JCM 17472 TaxID=1423802 RepID=A0A0R2CPD0_9LACO|nr:ABC transporter ATP-binding protein [Lentilactobacillus senioris]KRM93617.1 xenobiotic-transporting ATPase [Lentilactobacillus senioris DSM 24302 = JCM 17472]
MRNSKAIRKPNNFWQSTGRLIGYTKRWMPGIILAIVMAILAVYLQIVTPKILGKATTQIYTGVMAGTAQLKAGLGITHLPINFTKILHIISEVIILYILAGLAQLVQQIVMSRISQSIVYQMRKDMKAKMERLPISFYDQNSNGDIMSRAVNDMDNINTMLQSSLTQLITSFFMFFGVLYMMLTISWQLTLVALATVPVSGIIVGIVAPKSQKFFGTQQKELGNLNGMTEENYSGHNIIKTFNREETTIDDFEKQNEKYYQASWKAQFVSSFLFPLMNLVKNLDYVFVAVIGGIQVTRGQVTLGNIQAFLQYTNMLSQPITQLASLSNTIQSTIASAERIFAILDEPEMTDEPIDVPVDNADHSMINFENVDFSYVPEKPLIQNFNLRVNPGEMVAIVGPTGAGKTTIINLLERFYDIKSGSIKMKGKDTREESRSELRSHMAMVLQDTWLFTGTIYDNIKYGNENATEEEVYAAARSAHADTFIRELPNGYQTVLNENASNISQGQRQLLTIARAFLANPEILILDEATSSVDTRTEKMIQDAMDSLSAGRTSFVVAHRLSTIQNAENIVVMNHGQIIETGNHDVLMKQNGFYADLYNSQFIGNDLA